MFKAGIIDPLKVVRTALQNAASIAGLMLTTETLVTDLPKEDKKKRPRRRHGSLDAAGAKDSEREPLLRWSGPFAVSSSGEPRRSAVPIVVSARYNGVSLPIAGCRELRKA